MAVVDLDVHQVCSCSSLSCLDCFEGNGTAEIFKDEPRVFTLSVHNERNYPWKTRFLGDLDIGLDDEATSEQYTNAINLGLEIVKQHFADTPASRCFIIYQAGVDALKHDRFHFSIRLYWLTPVVDGGG